MLLPIIFFSTSFFFFVNIIRLLLCEYMLFSLKLWFLISWFWGILILVIECTIRQRKKRQNLENVEIVEKKKPLPNPNPEVQGCTYHISKSSQHVITIRPDHARSFCAWPLPSPSPWLVGGVLMIQTPAAPSVSICTHMREKHRVICFWFFGWFLWWTPWPPLILPALVVLGG